MSFFAIKNQKIKKAVDFSPSILIKQGVIQEKELVNNRVTLDEMLSMLRLQGYYDLSRVCFAILEPNGQLSVVPFENKEPPIRQELHVSATDNGFSVAVIDDGKINEKALELIGRSHQWVKEILKENAVNRAEEVLLLASDFQGNIQIFRKEKTK